MVALGKRGGSCCTHAAPIQGRPGRVHNGLGATLWSKKAFELSRRRTDLASQLGLAHARHVLAVDDHAALAWARCGEIAKRSRGRSHAEAGEMGGGQSDAEGARAHRVHDNASTLW